MLVNVLSCVLASLAFANGLHVQRTTGDVWGGINITTAALQIQASISSPTCSAMAACKTFSTSVIPQCLGVQGSPGCWCSMEVPMHDCSICMLDPTDNSTTAAETQTVTSAHMNFHLGCAAYEASINATATGSMSMDMSSMNMATSTSSSTATAAAANSGGSSTPVGAIVGGVVGGLVAIALIISVTIIMYRRQRVSGSQTGRHPGGIDTVPAPYLDGLAGGEGEPKPSYSPWQGSSTNGPPSSFLPYAGSTPSPSIPPYTARHNVVSTSTDYDVSMLNSLTPAPPFNPYNPSDRGQPAGDYAQNTIDSKGSRGYPNVAEPMR